MAVELILSQRDRCSVDSDWETSFYTPIGRRHCAALRDIHLCVARYGPLGSGWQSTTA